MNPEAMLEKCVREQWSIGDLDWKGTPRAMSEDDEIAIVQYFTDMAGIERLAAALFAEQERRATDPTLRGIFASFVKDEIRHSHAAQMLADYYDVHRYRTYRTNPALRRFTPHFVNLIRRVAPELANAYITGGELILDVALLRSLDDHVGDEMSRRVMALINRDESRHIAVDFHMVEHYASRAYLEELRARPRPSLPERARATWALAGVFWYAAPFFKSVFFQPMERLDPSGRRMKEAFKRIQLIAEKPNVAASPFVRTMMTLQRLYNGHPVVRALFGRAIARLAGVDERMMEVLTTDAERRRAASMSLDQMAEEALAAKYAA